jgi:hypothetical protein
MTDNELWQKVLKDLYKRRSEDWVMDDGESFGLVPKEFDRICQQLYEYGLIDLYTVTMECLREEIEGQDYCKRRGCDREGGTIREEGPFTCYQYLVPMP